MIMNLFIGTFVFVLFSISHRCVSKERKDWLHARDFNNITKTYDE